MTEPIGRKPSPEELEAIKAAADTSGPRTLSEAENAIKFQSTTAGF